MGIVFNISKNEKKLKDTRHNESGQQAWESGGVSEKATYRHTSNPLIL